MWGIFTASKYSGAKLGIGELAQAAYYKDRFNVPKSVTVDEFVRVYLLPVLQ